jgi:hypothetical protein
VKFASEGYDSASKGLNAVFLAPGVIVEIQGVSIAAKQAFFAPLT